ncbi:MAG: ABC-ATPase domain-containing protein [Thermoleophilia bacterium]
MDAVDLGRMLERLEGKGYKEYHNLGGSHSFSRFTLFIDRVQADPFAAPSRMRVRVAQEIAGFDPQLFSGKVRRVAMQDFLARLFARSIRKNVKGHRGTGKSGFVGIDSGGQEILERNAATINERYAEIRFVVGLPAAGRRCLGREAAAVLLDEVPRLVESSLFYDNINREEAAAHVKAAEDQQWLRSRLAREKLVAFVADGSVLPRASGISEAPLAGDRAVGFRSPPELRVGFDLPNRGWTSGMGIPAGVTLIIGGGYHGKSTLLKALERGVYCHVTGDGREVVATRDDAVKIRAEDGRRVEKVNISPFISNLPFGQDTSAFSTENASGSTSQAANIIEALEAGSRLLLIDEDTSATNFMIRDELMQRLISKDKEPITPLIDQVHNMYKEHGVSTVLVMGGSGDYFDVADTVLAMEDYQPRVVTAQARAVASSRPGRRRSEAAVFGPLTARVPLAGGLNPRRGPREKVSARGLGTIEFGRQTVDLAAVEQLVDPSQTSAIGDLVWSAHRRGLFDGKATLGQVLDRMLAEVEEGGLDVIAPVFGPSAEGGAVAGDYALPRRYEIAAMLNRLRSLKAGPASGGAAQVVPSGDDSPN